MLGQLFQVSIHFPIRAIRYNRRQETVSMPKYGPLLYLEFNTREKSLWLPEFYTVFPGLVCLLALLSLKSCLHQSLHSNCILLLLPSWKQVRDAEDLFSSFSWKRKFNDKKNCNQNGNPETGGLPWSLHFWYALWFFTGWSFPFSSFC